MPEYIDILKINVFKNTDRFADGGTPLSGGKPNYSNKVTLHTSIPAGEYSLGVWQYADTGNLSLKLTAKSADENAAAQPAPAQPNNEVLDDFT